MAGRVLIIALDGLDHGLVEQFDLHNLKQRKYGKVSLNIEPYTPLVWASFATGVPHFRSDLRRSVLVRIAGVELPLRYGSQMRNYVIWLLRRLRIQHAEVNWVRLRKATLFDGVPSAYVVNPLWRWGKHSWRGAEYMRLLFAALEGSLDEEECVRRAWALYSRQEEEFLKAIESPSWNLLMLYTQILDFLGHLLRADVASMWEIYAQIDERVGKLLGRLQEDCLKLVISDHGMQAYKGGGFMQGKASTQLIMISV